jgi:hypothetical protein
MRYGLVSGKEKPLLTQLLWQQSLSKNSSFPLIWTFLVGLGLIVINKKKNWRPALKSQLGLFLCKLTWINQFWISPSVKWFLESLPAKEVYPYVYSNSLKLESQLHSERKSHFKNLINLIWNTKRNSDYLGSEFIYTNVS